MCTLDLEQRIEAEGVEVVVRDVLSSLERLPTTERGARLAELGVACGICLGADPQAWESWLTELKDSGVLGGRMPAENSNRLLPAQSSFLADLLRGAMAEENDDATKVRNAPPREGGRRPKEKTHITDHGFPEIPGYEIVSLIGKGGMGEVYRAVKKSSQVDIALKILPEKLSRDRQFVKRFLREANIIVGLDHPNIVRGYEAGKAGGHYYIAMEYVAGNSLAELLDMVRQLPETYALCIAVQVGEALEHASRRDLLHRDVKPGNILLGPGDHVLLADFGLARFVSSDSTRLTQPGMAIGTVSYLSPEQARGEQDIDTRTDVYSLGATLFHTVVGLRPFRGKTPMEILHKVLTEPPPDARAKNPHVSDETSCVIRRALQKEPNKRYDSPGQMVEDMKYILRTQPIGGDKRRGTTQSKY